jgi:hypothetical protein
MRMTSDLRNPRVYLIFYPCKEEAFAMLRDVSTENKLIHVRRPDVNVIVRKEKDTSIQEKDCKDAVDANKDAILNAYK